MEPLSGRAELDWINNKYLGASGHEKMEIPFSKWVVASGFPYRLKSRDRQWGSCCFSPLPWIAACASSGMNYGSERDQEDRILVWETHGSVGRPQKVETHSRWLMEWGNRDLQWGRGWVQWAQAKSLYHVCWRGPGTASEVCTGEKINRKS